MSGASLGLTGYAWVGALCSWADNPGSNIGYGICGGMGSYGPIAWDGNQSTNPNDIYWDALCFAHEVGHNFGATHTHDSCGWEGVNAPIDQCSPSSVCPQPELRRLPTCSAPTPFFHGSGLGAGTIMSYCHNLQNPDGTS
jgi:hypothetical protein